MTLFLYRFNIIFFVLWVAWCVYRGVLCSLTSIPDILAPVNYGKSYPSLGFLLLVLPFIAPIVSFFVSGGCILIKVGSKWGNICIIVSSIVTMLFRILIKPNVLIPYWF